MVAEYEINQRTYRPPIKNYDGSPWRFAHWKRDGHMVRLEVEAVSTGPEKGSAVRTQWSAWTRRPTDISWDIHECCNDIQPMLRGLEKRPGRWLILGEIFYPGKPASYIKTGFKEKDRSVKFEAFAILRMPDVPMWVVEQLSIVDLQEITSEYNIPLVPHFNYQPESPEDLYSVGLRDVEGFVFKVSNLGGWQKWKEKKTIDLIVTGYEKGEGKYANLIGSIIVSTFEGHEVARVSGMTDAERKYISANMTACVGRVVEVEYQLVGSKGRLRHPVFKGFRDDKSISQCSVSQSVELESAWSK